MERQIVFPAEVLSLEFKQKIGVSQTGSGRSPEGREGRIDA